MFQQSLLRSTTHARAPVGLCQTCTCSCGRRIAPNGPPTSTWTPTAQKRLLGRQQSPAVRSRDQDREAKVITPAMRKRLDEKAMLERKRRDEQAMLEGTRVPAFLAQAHRQGHCESTEMDAIEFLNDFVGLCDESRSTLGGNSPVPLDAFQRLFSRHKVSEKDCELFAVHLRQEPDSEKRAWGTKLLFVLSHAGSERATMRIMDQTEKELVDRPGGSAGFSMSPELERASQHLKAMAAKGDSHRPMVLEGMIAYALGNHEEAIKQWSNAMSAAIVYAKKEEERRATGDQSPPEDDIFYYPLTGLDSPWIQLSLIFEAREEWTNTKWATQIGCDMDDPISHYRMACIFGKRTAADGELVKNSTWLYHMTKAAASSHAKAQHALGIFYGTSGWKYIEDEPPDHIKPTAFDSYPPPEDTIGERMSLGDRMRIAVGFAPKVEEDPTKETFHLATYPTSAEQRMQLALDWLQRAMDTTYAPSYLFAARLLLEEKLWSGMPVPKEALALSGKRYTYASKADKIAGRPIERPEEREEEEEEPDNPHYDKERAYELVQQVFYALAAQRAGIKHKAKRDRERRARSSVQRGKVRDKLDSELDSLEQNLMSARDKSWFRIPVVRKMYMDDERGVCEDDAQGMYKLNLEEGVKKLCEEQEWDVVGDDGGLLYEHGLQKGSGVVGRGRA